MDGFVGEIRLFAGDYAPENWLVCNGDTVQIREYMQLFSIIDIKYGGDGSVYFNLPDLRSQVPIGSGKGEGLTNRNIGDHGGAETIWLRRENITGHVHDTEVTTPVFKGKLTPKASTESDVSSPINAYPGKAPGDFYSEEYSIEMGVNKVEFSIIEPAAVEIEDSGIFNPAPHNNMMPFLTVNYIICHSGWYPEREKQMPGTLGEIRLTGGIYAPGNWRLCLGQVLNKDEYTELHNIIGELYGGDGKSTFLLPDIRGRGPLGQGGSYFPQQGIKAGTETESLKQEQIPLHTHNVKYTSPVFAGNVGLRASVDADTDYPKNCYPGDNMQDYYSESPDTVMADCEVDIVTIQPLDVIVQASGDSYPHNNMQPYLTVNYMICVKGDKPEPF